MDDKGTGGRARLRSRVHQGVRCTIHGARTTASIAWRGSSLAIGKVVSFSKKKSFELTIFVVSAIIAIATAIDTNSAIETTAGTTNAGLSTIREIIAEETDLAGDLAALKNEFADLEDREDRLAEQQAGLEKRRADFVVREKLLAGAWKQWLQQPLAPNQLKRLDKRQLQRLEELQFDAAKLDKQSLKHLLKQP